MAVSGKHVAYRLLLGTAVVAGWLAAYMRPRAPVLSWWLTCALVFGVWAAFEDTGQGLRGRAGRLVLLHIALLLSALGSTQLAARRVSAATHLRYRGVLVERTREISIGSGVAHADVLLPVTSPSQVPWRVVVRRSESGWTLDPATDVEQLRLSPVSARQATPLRTLFRLLRLKDEAFTVANAVLLSERTPMAVIMTRSGEVADTVQLAVDKANMVLRSSTLGDMALEPRSERLDARYRRMLAVGTSLALLDAPARKASSGSVPLDRLLRVQELSGRRDVNGDWSPGFLLIGAPRRFLLSASAPLVVRPDRLNAAPVHRLGDSTRVEVRQSGGVWRFDVVTMQRTPASDSGLSIRFVSTPKVIDIPLPASGECDAGIACGLLSLRPLPPPIAHISLGEAGLDTGRFGLLGALHATGAGLTLTLGRETIALPGGGAWTLVPVDSIEREDGIPRRPTTRPSRWLLLGAANNSLNGLPQLIGVALGLSGLLLVGLELSRTAKSRGFLGGSSTEGSLALVLSAVLTLLAARVVLGARVTFFSPENSAGLDTAIGMFVAIALATVALMQWDLWVPQVLRLVRAMVSPQRGAVKQCCRAWWCASEQLVGERRRQRARLPFLGGAMILLLGLLYLVSPRAVRFGASAGVLVVCVWLLIAWVGAFGGDRFIVFESPGEIVEHDVADRDERRSVMRWLTRLSLQWTVTLWSPIVGVLVAGGLFALRDVPRHRGLGKAGPAVREGADDADLITTDFLAEAQQIAGYLLTAVAVLASTLVIAWMRFQSENGAMASFLLIVLVSLTSVRIGRSLSAILDRRSYAGVQGEVATPTRRPSIARWEIASPLPASTWRVLLHLIGPLLLLAPLALIDMGLLLVTVLPIGAGALLAVGWGGLRPSARVGVAGIAAVLTGILWFKVLFPPLGAIAEPKASYVARAERFEAMRGLFGIPSALLAPVQASLDRTAARAVATRDREAAERLLIAAYPGAARDLLMPSIEQVWGGRGYAASRWAGHGQGTAPTRGHGIAEPVSYAENSFAVYVLYEHGALAGILLLSTYLVFAYGVLSAMYGGMSKQVERSSAQAELRASRALFLVAALLVTVPTAYVTLSNVGIVPITGQNMPFLGLNAWSDVTLAAGVCGMLMTAGIHALTRRESVR